MKELKKQFPFYSRMMKLYPRPYRQKYESEMLLTAADMLDDAPSRRSRLVVWLRLAADLPLNVARQQLEYAAGGLQPLAPDYLKRNGTLAGLLLLPFFAALAANGLDKLINNHTLYNSWLWQRPFIGLWIVILPVLALMLAAGSGLFYLMNSGAEHNRGGWSRLAAMMRTWQLLLVGAVAICILLIIVFHDSASCWAHNPVYVATHINQSWQCSKSNQADVGKILRRSL